MEKQDTLITYDRTLWRPEWKKIPKLQPNKFSLENEKSKFISVMNTFVDSFDLNTSCNEGRPRSDYREIIKCLLIMSFHGFSYRRACSDFRYHLNNHIISQIPSRSVLNRFMLDEKNKAGMEKLIQISAMFFIDGEDTIILDSSWLGIGMYTASSHLKSKMKDNAHSFVNTRKLHICCLKNSKVIAVAKATSGTTGDSLLFEELVSTTVNNGFRIKECLADAGYSSKDNYALCQELGINNTFIDFKSNASASRGKSALWKEKLTLFREQPDYWHSHYRYRERIEGIFSVLKRKHLPYVRSRKPEAQDIELLLKALVYNLEIIGKYS